MSSAGVSLHGVGGKGRLKVGVVSPPEDWGFVELAVGSGSALSRMFSGNSSSILISALLSGTRTCRDSPYNMYYAKVLNYEVVWTHLPTPSARCSFDPEM